MRARCGFLVLVFLFGAIGAAPSSGAQGASEEYLGTWSGTWEGAGSGSGGFEITLEKGADGALSGRVSVTGEPTYTATLKTASLEGQALTATYDFTPDDRAEVALEGNATNGTWVLREKASGSETASGTWTVKRT
jgi:hypothetical protein